MTKHIKPLCIKAYLNGVVLNRVLIDNGVVVNIISSSTLKKINKEGSKLVQIQVMISRFIEDRKDTIGVTPVETIVGLKKSKTTFFIVDVNPSYHALLGID